MDYDKIFVQDINKEFYFDKEGYPQNKMMVGTISYENAKARLSKGEYYILVKIHEGDVLPNEYVFLKDVDSIDDTFFATINPNLTMDGICKDAGSIQLISRINDTVEGPCYLLGPGPDKVEVSQLINEQLEAYRKSVDKGVTR